MVEHRDMKTSILGVVSCAALYNIDQTLQRHFHVISIYSARRSPVRATRFVKQVCNARIEDS